MSTVARFSVYCYFDMELIIGIGILELVFSRWNRYLYNVIDPQVLL